VSTVHNASAINPEQLASTEWLITNGIGGYASSTVSGINSRRYHGLLVAATHPPVGRLVMLSKLEDALIINGIRVDLSANRYGEGVLHPQGFRNLQHFRLDPFPIYTYAGEGFVLEKSIYMPRGENTVVIEYALTNCSTEADIKLEIAPLIAFRDYHATTHANGNISAGFAESAGSITLQPYGDLPVLHIAHDADEVVKTGVWYYNFEYSEERARGLDHREDQFNPLTLRASLHGKSKVTLIASTEPHAVVDAVTIRAAEIRRHHEIERRAASTGRNADLIRALSVAAEHFIVARPPFKTVIAGYHWFGDWGRDTMIALPGLLLCTDQPDAAKEILLQFLRYIHGGMLPNRFPDRGETPEYNTVDATLWFVDAIWQYLNYRADARWRREALELIRTQLYPGLKSIIHNHLAGTHYGIHADAQGFLWAGDDSTQLTWMDAKVGDIAITPRAGRPVEIQALWYNAIRTVEEFGKSFGDAAAADYCAGVANRLKANFERVFWNEPDDCLYDVVSELSADASIRPNQVLAVSLRHNLLDPAKTRKVLENAKKHLLTPYGLRTLASSDSRYRARYGGDVWSRDSAYHQGTVWPWLAGPYFTSLLRYTDQKDAAIAEAQAWLDRFSGHLEEACLGQISEVFDGGEPHHPGGCIAQAWSVAELLRLAKLVDQNSKGFEAVNQTERQLAGASRGC
jgi:predicted glycogen debranching enzyme